MEKIDEIKDEMKVCKSVTVSKDDDGDICLSIKRTGTSYTATINQVRYLESLENYIGKASHYRLMKVHCRVMSTIIDMVKHNTDLNFYLSI